MSACALLTWKNPIETGKVFGSIVVSLIVLKYVNLVNLFFRLAWVALLASAAAEYSGKLVTGTGFVTKYRPTYKSCAKHFNQVVLPNLAEFNENLEAEVQKIIFSADIEETLKAGGVSYILYKITSWLSFYTILVSSVVLAFTVPAIYSNFKTEIDQAIAQLTKLIREKSSEVSTLAQERATPILKSLEKSLGPVGSFISSKIPVRTASSTVGEPATPIKSTSTESHVPTTTVPAVHTDIHSFVDEPSFASTTSASKFPEVPSSIQKSVHEVKLDEPSITGTHSISDIADEIKAQSEPLLN